MSNALSNQLDAIGFAVCRLRQWLDTEEVISITDNLLAGAVIVVSDTADNWGMFSPHEQLEMALSTIGHDFV